MSALGPSNKWIYSAVIEIVAGRYSWFFGCGTIKNSNITSIKDTKYILLYIIRSARNSSFIWHDGIHDTLWFHISRELRNYQYFSDNFLTIWGYWEAFFQWSMNYVLKLCLVYCWRDWKDLCAFFGPLVSIIFSVMNANCCVVKPAILKSTDEFQALY